MYWQKETEKLFLYNLQEKEGDKGERGKEDLEVRQKEREEGW